MEEKELEKRCGCGSHGCSKECTLQRRQAKDQPSQEEFKYIQVSVIKIGNTNQVICMAVELDQIVFRAMCTNTTWKFQSVFPRPQGSGEIL